MSERTVVPGLAQLGGNPLVGFVGQFGSAPLGIIGFEVNTVGLSAPGALVCRVHPRQFMRHNHQHACRGLLGECLGQRAWHRMWWPRAGSDRRHSAWVGALYDDQFQGPRSRRQGPRLRRARPGHGRRRLRHDLRHDSWILERRCRRWDWAVIGHCRRHGNGLWWSDDGVVLPSRCRAVVRQGKASQLTKLVMSAYTARPVSVRSGAPRPSACVVRSLASASCPQPHARAPMGPPRAKPPCAPTDAPSA